MQGTAKQAAWATAIKDRKSPKMREHMETYIKHPGKLTVEQAQAIVDRFFAAVDAQVDPQFWIKREQVDAVSIAREIAATMSKGAK